MALTRILDVPADVHETIRWLTGRSDPSILMYTPARRVEIGRRRRPRRC
jgi:hypothetical protein